MLNLTQVHPVTCYHTIHSEKSVKDLHHSIDSNVCLEACNKSSIRQLGTCHLTVRHGKQSLTLIQTEAALFVSLSPQTQTSVDHVVAY